LEDLAADAGLCAVLLDEDRERLFVALRAEAAAAFLEALDELVLRVFCDTA